MFTIFFQVKYVWTSGRLCDFKGCDRPDLLPNNINGWFWTAELQKLAPTTDRRQGDWSGKFSLKYHEIRFDATD